MTTEVVIAIIGVLSGLLGTFVFYTVVIVSRFVRLETDVLFMRTFFNKIQEKSLELLIRTDTPEIDHLLNLYRAGDASEEEMKRLLYLVKQQHIQAIRREDQLEKDAGRKVVTAIFLAGIEAEYVYLKELKTEQGLTKWQRVRHFLKKLF
jgi:hypothetical protein